MDECELMQQIIELLYCCDIYDLRCVLVYLKRIRKKVLQ